MNTITFAIKSVLVQNLIMAVIFSILLLLLLRAARKRSCKCLLAVSLWTAVVLWFFNSPLWGFSAVTVGPKGLKLHYGALSVAKNTTLPVDTTYEIKTYMGGVRKIKKLYYLELGRHRSMKVRGRKNLAILQDIGRTINRLNDRPMGNICIP
ncbi:MAG: hypothetical protein ACQES8_03155 [Thermodesulfobacteriota bacterium]